MDSAPPEGQDWGGPQSSALACPRGMVPAGVDPRAFCVDRYEVQLDEQGLPRSLEGVVPTMGVSFRQAQAACAAVDRHLVTASEWEDAADGKPGVGGRRYVYGDSYEGTTCVDPEAGFPEVQPTGSLPGCVSLSGTYDQTGNAWEWTDPEVPLDARLSLSDRWSEVLIEAEGERLSVIGSLAEARLEAAGWSGELIADEQGLLVLEAAEAGPVQAGYLVLNEHRDEPRSWLPIRVEGEVPGRTVVFLAADRDGDPMTDKRGGSYYSGGEEASRNDASNYTHDADFEGSIGFRCAVSLSL